MQNNNDDDDEFDSEEQAKKSEEDQSFIILADLNQIRGLAQKNSVNNTLNITQIHPNVANSTKTNEQSSSPPNVKTLQLNGLGRDSQGHFKNHKHFEKLRNKINLQESKHKPMFDSILMKLQDKSFLEQAIS
jgi:hypothetical protein